MFLQSTGGIHLDMFRAELSSDKVHSVSRLKGQQVDAVRLGSRLQKLFVEPALVVNHMIQLTLSEPPAGAPKDRMHPSASGNYKAKPNPKVNTPFYVRTLGLKLDVPWQNFRIIHRPAKSQQVIQR